MEQVVPHTFLRHAASDPTCSAGSPDDHKQSASATIKNMSASSLQADRNEGRPGDLPARWLIAFPQAGLADAYAQDPPRRPETSLAVSLKRQEDFSTFALRPLMDRRNFFSMARGAVRSQIRHRTVFGGPAP